jgi:hypothetical protein
MFGFLRSKAPPGAAAPEEDPLREAVRALFVAQLQSRTPKSRPRLEVLELSKAINRRIRAAESPEHRMSEISSIIANLLTLIDLLDEGVDNTELINKYVTKLGQSQP